MGCHRFQYFSILCLDFLTLLIRYIGHMYETTTADKVFVAISERFTPFPLKTTGLNKLLFSQLIVLAKRRRRQKIVKNASYNVPKLNVIYLNGFFYSTSRPNLRNIQFTSTYDEETHQILTFH